MTQEERMTERMVRALEKIAAALNEQNMLMKKGYFIDLVEAGCDLDIITPTEYFETINTLMKGEGFDV